MDRVILSSTLVLVLATSLLIALNQLVLDTKRLPATTESLVRKESVLERRYSSDGRKELIAGKDLAQCVIDTQDRGEHPFWIVFMGDSRMRQQFHSFRKVR